MAFISFENIKEQNLNVIGQAEFKRLKNISRQAFVYAMNNDLLDWTEIGNVKMAVDTEKTRNYTPNASKTRELQGAR